MKMRIAVASALFMAVTCTLQGQNLGANGAPAAQATQPSVVSRDAHSKRWEWTTVDETGKPHKHAYQELATGLNYRDDQTGEWRDSVEEIELFNGAAIFRQGQHRIIFPRDIADGELNVLNPGGQLMKSKIYGLAYFDPASGRSVLLASLKSSVGQLVQKNQLIYLDAFEGEEGVVADVRFTVTKMGFSQDVVVRPSATPFPAPSEWGLPNESTHLVVMSEFLISPEPSLVAQKQGVDLDFGSMRMITGKAFLDGEEDASVPVQKSWEKIDNSVFLVEAVKFSDVKPALEKLSRDAGIQTDKKTARVEPKTQGKSVMASLASGEKLRRATAQSGTKRDEKIQLAALEQRPGFTIDYNQINSSQISYRFNGDTTTYISDSLSLYGTTTIEPNSVLKFSENVSVKMTVNGPVICLTEPYRPAVLSSVNDDEVGEAIPTSTGTPSNVSGATYLADANTTTNTYKYLRFAYAGVGLEMSAEVGGVWHSQFYKCATAIKSTGGHAVNLFNVLVAQCTTGLNVSSANAYGQHVTLDQSTTAITNATAGYFTNSLVTASTGTNTLQLYSSLLTNNTAGVFQTVGGGSYYLATNTLVGTSSIDAALKTDLAKLTVFPPVVYSNVTITTVAVLSPQATRDTNYYWLGYHYPPLDHVFGGSDGNTNITFTAGTAVGWFRTTSGFYHAGHGLHMDDRQIVTFDGTAEAPCYWVRCNVVQEGGTGIWLRGAGPGGITGWADQAAQDVTRSPEIRARFTRFSVMAADENHFRDDNGYLITRATHSEFYSGGTGGYINSLYLTNCLMDRVLVAQNAGWTNTAFVFRNVTFHGGSLSYNRYASAMLVTIRDTAFDGTTFSVTDGQASNTNCTDYAYNAFLANVIAGTPTNVVTDIFVTNFNWQSSLSRNFYLPSDSPLINAGSQNATNLGLYHFTTQTNDAKEASSVVDIAFHRVATDVSGNPLDSDGNLTPDYLVDANGNGFIDAGESPFVLPPYVAISSPSNLAVVTSDTLVSVTATNLAANVTLVQLFTNNAFLGNDASSPFAIPLNACLPGSYALVAVASNQFGLKSTSSVVNVTITVPAASDLRVWLKADALTGLTNLQPIQLWTDSSGFANNARQFTAAYQPLYVTNVLNGLPVVRFDGTNDHYSLTNSMAGWTQGEMFVVLKVANALPLGSRGAWTLGGAITVYPRTDGKIDEGFGLSTYKATVASPQPLDQFHFYNVYSKTNDWANSINGLNLYSTNVNLPAFPSTPYIAGASSFFGGDMAEILLYQRMLSSDEREAVGTYLNQKYGFIGTPNAPSNVTVQAVAPDQLRISWSTNTSTVKVTFNVERRDGTDGPFALVGTTTQTNFIDSGVNSTTEYSYRVTASTYGRDSSPSSTVAPPIIRLASPSEGAILPTASAGFSVIASDPDGSVVQVELLTNSRPIAVSASAPCIISLINPPVGTITYQARATDNQGNTRMTSVTVAIIQDEDGDGLSNLAEILLGTDPTVADTDGDGVIDSLDPFPLDPTRWTLPAFDTTAPVIDLDEPEAATPL